MRNAVLSGFQQITTTRILFTIFAMVFLQLIASGNTIIQLFRNETIVDLGFTINFVIHSIQSNSVRSFIPLLSTIPFSSCYLDAHKCRFARFCLIRSTYRTYLISLLISCFFFSASIILSGVIIYGGISFLIFLPLESSENLLCESLESISSLVDLYSLLFLNSGMWAIIGMSMSSLFESKYIAHLSPFIIYYILLILYERYIPNLYIIYPIEWIMPTDHWPFKKLGVIIILFEICILFSSLFIIHAERKCHSL